MWVMKVVMRRATILAAGLLIALLPGCHSVSPELVGGSDAFATTGTADPQLLPGAYVIGPADELKVVVLYEPELSLDPRTVDTNGEISVPLIGKVQAAGKTADDLSTEIQQRLTRFMRDPHVVVTVTQFARQNVTVEGSVTDPGVYPIPGTSSLLQSLALAKGPDQRAKLDEVMVFRQIDGQRMGAVFDLRRIRYGYDPDPVILGGDVVVVGFSELKGAYRDFLTAAPLSGIFHTY